VGHATSDTILDTALYSIIEGKLYLWSEGDCVAGSMSGSSTTIIGSWTATGVVGSGNPGERVLVPSNYRASSCPSTLPPDTSHSQGLPIVNPASTLTISASKIDIQESGDLCYAEKIYGDTANHFFGSSNLTVTSASCSSVSLTNAVNQRTFTATSGFQNNKVNVSVASGGRTCTSTFSLNLPGTTPDCSEMPFYANTSFTNCVDSLVNPPVLVARPTVSYTSGTVVDTVGKTATHNATTTGTVSDCRVSPALPAGLNLNSANCNITGVPTVAAAAANYTITDSNSAGTGCTVLNLGVVSTTTTYTINVSVTGLPVNSNAGWITGVQVCADYGSSSGGVCGQDGVGFSTGTGTLSVTAAPGTGYTVSVPGNQPAAAVCTVISGGSGVLGPAMLTVVVNCH
jgi:hypothetical protein